LKYNAARFLYKSALRIPSRTPPVHQAPTTSVREKYRQASAATRQDVWSRNQEIFADAIPIATGAVARRRALPARYAATRGRSFHTAGRPVGPQCSETRQAGADPCPVRHAMRGQSWRRGG